MLLTSKEKMDGSTAFYLLYLAIYCTASDIILQKFVA